MGHPVVSTNDLIIKDTSEDDKIKFDDCINADDSSIEILSTSNDSITLHINVNSGSKASPYSGNLMNL